MNIKGFSCNSGLLSEYEVTKAMDILVKNNYQGIEICLEPNPPFYPVPKPHMSGEDDSSYRKKVKKYAEDAGIKIPALNAHTNLIDGNPLSREVNFNFVKDALKLASDLEVNIVITGGGAKNLYGYEDSYWSILIDKLNKLLELANKLGVIIAIEAAGLPGNLIYNANGMKKLFNKIESKNLKVLFDPSHYFIRGDDILKTFNIFKDRIVHIHAKDAIGDYENFVFPPLGDGKINFKKLCALITDFKYDGFISVEYESFAWGYDLTPEQVLFNSKQFLLKYL